MAKLDSYIRKLTLAVKNQEKETKADEVIILDRQDSEHWKLNNTGKVYHENEIKVELHKEAPNRVVILFDITDEALSDLFTA